MFVYAVLCMQYQEHELWDRPIANMDYETIVKTVIDLRLVRIMMILKPRKREQYSEGLAA